MTKRMDELNSLEEAEAEKVSGTSILAMENDQPVAKLLAALAWVHKRRTDPKLTYVEYLKSARTKDNVQYLFRNDDEDQGDEDQGDEDEEPSPAVDGGPHPDAVDRVLDDEGVPTDPFPETSSPLGSGEAPEGPDDAEGSVLPLQRGSA